MTAKSDFLSDMAALEMAMSSPATTSLAYSEGEHNQAARLLRNGLMVVGFSALERFLRRRTEEVFTFISSAGHHFASLPSSLQAAVTDEAIQALAFQLRLRRSRSEDTVAFVQQMAATIASTATGAYELCPLAFGQGSSNIGPDDVRRTLEVLGVKDGWGEITGFGGRCSLGYIPARAAFSTAVQRRNSAAHDPATDTRSSELDDFLVTSLRVGLGFDALLSRCGRRLHDGDEKLLKGSMDVRQSSIPVRFLDVRGSIWAEVPPGSRHGRAFRRFATREEGVAAAKGRAEAKREVVVVRDAALRPMMWVTTDLA